MEDKRPIQNRLLYRILRLLSAAMTLVAGLFISFACIAALFGDQEMLIELVDEDVESLSLNASTTVAIIVTNISAIATMCLLFFSMNRFLKHAGRGELLHDSARKALTRLGVAMIMLYTTSLLIAVLIPSFGIPGFWAENSITLLFLFFDMDFLLLLIGVVLLVLGEALREGQAAKEEAKQYV